MDNKVKKEIENQIEYQLENQKTLTGKIEFNLNDFDAKRQLQDMLNVNNYQLALEEIDNRLRSISKYGDNEYKQLTKEVLEDKEFKNENVYTDIVYQIREDVQKIIFENGVKLDE